MIFPSRKCQLVQLVSLNKILTVSRSQIVLVLLHNRTGNVLVKLISLNDYSLRYRPVSPTGQFKQSLDSFYVTDSPLSVTNIAEMAMFYIKMTSLSDFPQQEVAVSPTGEFK